MNIFYIVVQIISLAGVRIIFPLFVKHTIKGLEHVASIDEPVIFIANHNSRLDPVYMTSFLPNRLYKKLVPFRFMTAGTTMRKPRSIPGLWISGCFPVEPGTGTLDEVLKNALKILNIGGNAMVIFPEAKMHKVGEAPCARPGIAFLGKETGRLIVPVGLSGMREMGWFSFWRPKRAHLSVHYGKPFYYNDIASDGDDLRQVAQKMMNRVYDLMKIES